MNAASYAVSGSGPNGATFSPQSTTGGPLTVNGLAFGTWSITVNDLNAGGTVIGSGQASATVRTGVSTPVSIAVTPLGGSGTFSLTVSWSTSQVEVPSITASLIPQKGSSTDLNFPITNPSLGSQTQTYSVACGYQTLILQLWDNNIAIMGAVEVVRIVAGQTTTGS